MSPVYVNPDDQGRIASVVVPTAWDKHYRVSLLPEGGVKLELLDALCNEIDFEILEPYSALVLSLALNELACRKLGPVERIELHAMAVSILLGPDAEAASSTSNILPFPASSSGSPVAFPVAPARATTDVAPGQSIGELP